MSIYNRGNTWWFKFHLELVSDHEQQTLRQPTDGFDL